MANLLTTPTLVESPIIILRVGDYTFGSYRGSALEGAYSSKTKTVFPNYMKSIRIVKTNGVINQYTIAMEYAIAFGDDPNLLDKIFSKVGFGGKIYITYGDCASPSFVYKEEEAIITKITTTMDFSGSKINYTISATGTSYQACARRFSFPARNAKPSDIIKWLLYNREYGLLEIFSGMKDRAAVERFGLIMADDRVVKLEAKKSVTVLEYLNFLVNCMQSTSDTGSGIIRHSNYYLVVMDEVGGDFNGSYFKIRKASTDNAQVLPYDAFEVDVGYPSDNMVMAFNVTTDQNYLILYNYEGGTQTGDYVYKINNEGEMVKEYSQSLTTSRNLQYTTAQEADWWTKVTQFPIQATMTIKGLIRPSMLMQKVQVNVLFYGKRHTSSGLYAITRQEDIVDGSGYRTTLTLLREGDITQKNNNEQPVQQVGSKLA